MKNILILILFLFVFNSCKDDSEPLLEVTACFEYNPAEVVAGLVQFKNCSENATDYYWDFGDGSNSVMKDPLHKYEGLFPFEVKMIASNEDYSDTLVQLVHDELIVKKPNIYIYPLTNINLCVDIFFPLGGEVVESIPKYNEGWCVEIDTDGKINNQYDYLFYESKQPNLFQKTKGWSVKREDLKEFFVQNMLKYNFSNKEIKDFIDYWIPRLNDSNYYNIYPQTKDDINKTNRINFSVMPDSFYRLFYSIQGVKEISILKKPEIISFDRDGYFIVEWGVIIH